MHIYAFGSICRGEVSQESDVDLLAIVDSLDLRFNPLIFSIYSHRRIKEIWAIGSPFAWHLYLEAMPLFLSGGVDFLRSLGEPSPYLNYGHDCKKFLFLSKEACRSIESKNSSRVFDLSIVFLGIRNIATCFALGKLKTPVFSRHSALQIGEFSLRIDKNIYEIFERARILSTRGKGLSLDESEIECAMSSFGMIISWMESIVQEAENDG